MAPVVKFSGTQSEHDHGGPLSWPGALDLPVRGESPLGMPQGAFDGAFEIVGDFHHAEFDLSDPEQDKKYNEVMDRITNRWYALHFIDRVRDEETGKRLVYLEWVQRYSVMMSPPDRLASAIARVG